MKRELRHADPRDPAADAALCDFTAVDALTIALEPGEVFELLAVNGAGKTVRLKMLTTLLPPSLGTAHMAGFDVPRDAAAQTPPRAGCGHLPAILCSPA